MTRNLNQPSDPLNFWMAVEAFSPQNVPALSKSRGEIPYVADYSGHQPLPWEENSRWPASRAGFAWQHTVYVGVFDLESAWDVLQPPTVEEFNAKPSRSSVITVTVSEDGTLIPDTAVLSQCVWAAGQYVKRRQLADVFTDFAVAETKWRTNLDDLIVARGIRVGADSSEGFRTHPVAERDLTAILSHALDATDTTAVLTLESKPVAGFRIKSEQVSLKRVEPETGSDFLNSPYSADLYRLSLQPRNRGSIRQYLGLDTPTDKVDIQKNLRAVYDSVAPDLVPDGRWPSNTDYPLALSQQFAVNRVLADLNEVSGIFSVNGPPGTGKTTMLRDLIAALVTQRAAALSTFTNPSDAFVEKGTLKTSGNFPRTVHRLHDSLRGYEIVIASSNNGAVENISLEIPAKNDNVIAPQFQKDLPYFSDIATLLLSEKDSQGRWKKPQDGAWGLISAKLGNAKNKGFFLSTALYSEDANEKEGLPKVQGLYDLLKDVPTAEKVSWSDARQAFLTAQSRVHRLRDERQKLHDAFLELPILRREVSNVGAELKTFDEQCKVHQHFIEEQRTELARIRQYESARRIDLKTHIAAKPGLLEQIFTFGKTLGPWRERQVNLTEEITTHQSSIAGMEHILDDAQRTLSTIRHHHQQSKQTLEGLQRQQKRLESTKTSYRHSDSYPSAQWFDPDNRERDKTSPWLDCEYNEARSLLFLEALKLHKAFVLDQSIKMRQNLMSFQDVLKNATTPEAQPEHVRWAWEALFMLVPTATTTFASTPRMFASLQNEQLGWLFIDEAGQAAPQHAYCGIARTHRTVLVGDPLQLTPVITLPEKYQNQLLEITGTDEEWLPAANPAQVLADRSTKYGTLIQPPGSDEIWIGAPLRVHRRCDNPMFDAVNSQVYGGLMIHGEGATPRDYPIAKPELQAPPSAWFDVQTPHWNGHASPQEITKLKELLQTLKESGYDMSKILVISPFKDTETRMSMVVREAGISAKTHAGTIHKAQGKEADIVIVILGGQSGGARNWAISSPNLFNVAVSRAKRRLYIIGDHRNWSSLQYFKALAPELDIHASETNLSEIFESTTPQSPPIAAVAT
ncbi:AAA domain-containing protein [Arthrobacter alpinus]|uniref:AAA domain-containing protein n=1 Tax=Arthrobacter alpinus TaxID=656366 RepID=A0A1H5PD70_9MICC|nr:ATP-binding protein [Arthrobacter alpinus]SEF11843.1 AAA domain-containing protein [Arthrobacter alpinus]